MTFDQLCLWYSHTDRIEGRGVIIPFAHIEKAIRDAAKAEGKEFQRLPWESGAEHYKRLQAIEK